MFFVSHASQDRSAIDGLLAVLRRALDGVWLDDELGGGQAWWQAILEKIRECDVFIVALSNNSLASKPCRAELRYAQALRRPVFPVQIGPVDSVRVTPFAATQILDYRNPLPETDLRLIAALQRSQAQAGPLPSALPEEPEVPFAYLMRLATVLASSDLSHYEQAGLVAELRNKLDEDCADLAAHRDIVRLLYLLRDRPDVTWRTRSDVDALLGVCDASLTNPVGLATVPFTRPLPVELPTDLPPAERSLSRSGFTIDRLASIVNTAEGPLSSGLHPIVEPAPSGLLSAAVLSKDRARPTRVAAQSSSGASTWRSRLTRGRCLLAGGLGVAVIAAAGTAMLYRQPEPQQPGIELLDDEILDTIMGSDGIQTAESGNHRAKHTSGMIEVSPLECASVLYPGLDKTYRDSGGQVTWRVSEDRGGMGRAGVDDNLFVDQDVAVFPDGDHALAFIRASAIPWKACVGQTVSVTYRGTETYTWDVGEVAGDLPMMSQSFTLSGGTTYRCQRVLRMVTNMVLDAKACGNHVDDEAGKIAARLAAALTDSPPY